VKLNSHEIVFVTVDFFDFLSTSCVVYLDLFTVELTWVKADLLLAVSCLVHSVMLHLVSLLRTVSQFQLY